MYTTTKLDYGLLLARTTAHVLKYVICMTGMESKEEILDFTRARD
jgi:hypothetical protein